MCDDCGCMVHDGNRHLVVAEERQTIEVLENLLQENDRQAVHIRQHLDQLGVFAVNLMSSPGSGSQKSSQWIGSTRRAPVAWTTSAQ